MPCKSPSMVRWKIPGLDDTPKGRTLRSFPLIPRCLPRTCLPLVHRKTHYDSMTPPQGPGRRSAADLLVGIFPASCGEDLTPGVTSCGAAVAILGHQSGSASPRDRPVTLRASACLVGDAQPQSRTPWRVEGTPQVLVLLGVLTTPQHQFLEHDCPRCLASLRRSAQLRHPRPQRPQQLCLSSRLQQLRPSSSRSQQPQLSHPHLRQQKQSFLLDFLLALLTGGQPAPGRFGASIVQKRIIFFQDEGALTKRMCEKESLYGDGTDRPLLDCCACGTAKYRVTFFGNWSEKIHPKDFPRRTNHWSATIGASHSKNYVLWEFGGLASEGVKQVAELGSPVKMEEEIRQKISIQWSNCGMCCTKKSDQWG
ncbi:hypothetical protein CRENBAI_017265 [Crenichthys baileyi]|uniref:Spondin domain-containing protein n=1 Tax=Crenichthys baileyi TaxID=28760 RepID=A0AAV9QZY6_9TELE